MLGREGERGGGHGRRVTVDPAAPARARDRRPCRQCGTSGVAVGSARVMAEACIFTGAAFVGRCGSRPKIPMQLAGPAAAVANSALPWVGLRLFLHGLAASFSGAVNSSEAEDGNYARHPPFLALTYVDSDLLVRRCMYMAMQYAHTQANPSRPVHGCC